MEIAVTNKHFTIYAHNNKLILMATYQLKSDQALTYTCCAD